MRQSIDESLARLQTDYVDLYMIHWPRRRMHVEPMLEALDQVVRAGKARFVGCSNFPAWLVARCNAVAERNGWLKLVCNQVPYSALNRGIEVEVLPQAVAEGIAITTYRPLLAGVLAGRYRAGEPIPGDSRGSVDRRLQAWCEKHAYRIERFECLAADEGLHPAQLAIAWVRSAPGVTAPIVGCSSIAQAEVVLDAFDLELTDQLLAAVGAIFENDDEQLRSDDWLYFPKMQRTFELIAR
ncbi:MAG: aldo/keto reductase [Deltaproteobacteria bacterium]|nr:aldo/keto reductase [Deltaproteobacteria bacterium]